MENNRRSRHPHRSGFTLVEVMIVLLIIVTIMGFGVVGILNYLDRANKRSAFAYVHMLKQQVTAYTADVGTPPTQEQGLMALVVRPADLPDPGKYMDGGYLEALSLDPWGRDYYYKVPGEDGRKFDIWTYGPSGIPGSEDTIGSWMSKVY